MAGDSLQSATGTDKDRRPAAATVGGNGPADVNAARAPSISLPKGGGAIRGIGEKFAANLVTGTGSMTVPIATSPGRSGFGPQLSLSYDSGSGNGPFGIGWSLSLPSITRRTDKGLPGYRDAEESDVFILSGAEDLVPVFKRSSGGFLVRNREGNPVFDEEERDGFLIRRYRPRIEGLFARIERWTRLADGDAHWRSISKDNVLTVYGSSPESRIMDPDNPSHVFSWLICQTYDDKGSAIVYSYAAENADNVDLSLVNERNRVRTANRYLKGIQYGNRQPLLIDPTQPSFRQSHVPAPDFSTANWMFELVFDYGEGHYEETPPDGNARTFAAATLKPPPGGSWPVRLDPYSTYRSCFEVRCYRLCRRVLLFHHFPEELGANDYLVRSTEFKYNQQPNGSFISEVSQSGFRRIGSAHPPYLKRSLPPLEFEYSVSPLDDLTFNRLKVQEVDSSSLLNLPSGIDTVNYRWIDLDGEGISGVLTEDADAWHYKRNLGSGRFGPIQQVSPLPSLAALNSGRQQLLDLAGDGNLDLVDFSPGVAGYFSRADDATWDRLRRFASLPNIDWQDPNLRFLDLTGDGRADVFLTEDQAFSTWFESMAEKGFGQGNRVAHPLHEEDGPRLVFADGTESIYVADMSGDGLSDLVRIRNGEVCYWPNIGYGRFGAKVSLNNAPRFDDPESFDQRRIHLADTDGSGPTDILYLGVDGVRVYLNQHGNSLSKERLLERVPSTGDLTTLSVVDFLGHGTACLVWSSPLPADARRPLRYLDLMGGIKPHLLTRIRNNLGSETEFEYKSSTEFYLADKAAGTPWITRLPFPVHVVTRVVTNDLISGNRFSTTYTYHHGYFDGVEREFRGFGRVGQLDTEEFGALGPATNQDQSFHVPPTLTKTWFHTGAYFKTGRRISRHLEHEYYQEEGLTSAELEAMLLPDTVLPEDLQDSERREACRSLKGAVLRREIYGLDGKPESTRPYSVSESNYGIKLLQHQETNRHSVFFTHPLETIDFHYERKVYPVAAGRVVDASQNPGAPPKADPRVSHAFNLAVDDYGNVLQSVAVSYGRRFDDSDPILSLADRKKQRQLAIILTEARFTNAVLAADAYRTPLSAEMAVFEVVNVRSSFRPGGGTHLFRLDELAEAIAKAGDGAHDLPFEDVHATGAAGPGPYRRLIGQKRILYRSNRLTHLLPLSELEALALAGESYQLAFTPGLLRSVYGHRLPDPAALLPGRGGYADLDGDGNWWTTSDRVFYHPDPHSSAASELHEAAGHFFLARRFRDPFGQETTIEYANDLLPTKVTDALGNTNEASYDFRALQPHRLTDPNGNRSSVLFDTLGLAAASAVAGKISEAVGDSLDGFGSLDVDLTLGQLQGFVAGPTTTAPALVKNATNRFVYDLDRFRRCGEPPFAATLARETHASEPLPPQGLKIQVSFTYSDGFGREVQSKVPAEPGRAAIRTGEISIAGGDIRPGRLKVGDSGVPSLGNVNPRWVGKGRTVYNNKGKPVKEYEPFFSSTHLFELEPEMTDTGVTPILLYDPLDRVVATLHPNHTYEKVVFDPWRQEVWDVNDTVLLNPKADQDIGPYVSSIPADDYLPSWFDRRRGGEEGAAEQEAAWKAAAHAGTPAVSFSDPLGRAFLAVQHNRVRRGDAPLDEYYATRMDLDVQGNRRSVTDALGRVIMTYDYDLGGGKIHQNGADAGERWTVNDVAGKPILAFDSRNHRLRGDYDALRRPTALFLSTSGSPEQLAERTEYGESQPHPDAHNLRGKAYRQFDAAGVVTSHSYDFKGNLLSSSRQVLVNYRVTADWNASPRLDGEVFSGETRYDALNRPVTLTAPDQSVLKPAFNEANLLEQIHVSLKGPSSFSPFVTNIDYNAKGQREFIKYGNGASTTTAYDPLTFRLAHLKTTRSQDGAELQDLVYAYDPIGNISSIADAAQQTVYFKNQVVSASGGYVYDAIYRLIKAEGREHIGNPDAPEASHDDFPRVHLPLPGDGHAMRNYREQYQYDAVGNILEVMHSAVEGSWRRGYEYDQIGSNNRLTKTTVGERQDKYTYDPHGNMMRMQHLPSMTWDFKDQLHSTQTQVVNSSEAETTYYIYNSGGQRVRKVTVRDSGNRRTERIYLGAFEMYREYSVGGDAVTLERTTLHIVDDKRRIALVEARGEETTVRYQFDNHLGSAYLELDDEAAIISYEEYYPYGSTSYQAGRSVAEVGLKRYRFTGKERDTETGFSYHGARYYVPWLGRWTSCDPVLLRDGSNTYDYVRGNPVRLTDPSGRYSVGEFFEDVGSGLWGAAKGIAEPALIVMDFGQMGAAMVTHAITGDPDDLDVHWLSGFGNKVAAGENPWRAALVMGTAIPTGGGSALVDNVVTVFEKDMSPEEARRFLVRGAVAQVATTGLAATVSATTGSGLTGRGGAVDPAADLAMMRNLTEARNAAGKAKVGDATFAQGRDSAGNLTDVMESVDAEGGTHAEPQVISALPRFGGRTVAVDQIPCEACWPELSGVPKAQQPGIYQGDPFGSMRVIVPRNPQSMATGPKTVALKAAQGKVSPVMQESVSVSFAPPLVPFQSQSSKGPGPALGSGLDLTDAEIKAQQCLPENLRYR